MLTSTHQPPQIFVVYIALFVKDDNLKQKICRADLRGSEQQEKYDWLNENSLTSTQWIELQPQSPFYFFTERDYDLEKEYNQFIQVDSLFPVHSSNLTTHRDDFVIDFDRDALERRIRQFRDKNLPDEIVREALSLRDNRDWKMSEKRKLIQQDDDWKDSFTKILYRPFDKRHIFYHYHAIDFGREEIMRHMLAGENLALVTAKSNKSATVDHFFCTDSIAETKCGESTTRSYIFPLYRYPSAEKRDLFSGQGDGQRVPNIDGAFYDALAAAYGERPAPEAVLHYVYAVLYAPAFRATYAEFLKTDFPKIPFPLRADLFRELAALGKKLTALHLLRADVLEAPTCRFHGEGSGRVAKAKRVGRNYDAAKKRVTINDDGQHFGPIAPAVWDYQIGGYQVLDKWLYDRRERVLSLEEIRHYCRVVTALRETIRLQEEIDAVYGGVEERLLEREALGERK